MTNWIPALLFAGTLLAVIFWILSTYPSQSEKRENQLRDSFEKCESPIEKKLFLAFTLLGVHPRGQIPAGRYRIDITFLRNGRKVAIECDGKDSHSSPDQKLHDKKKDEFLSQQGWIVIRVKGSEINKNAMLCAQRVLKQIDALPSELNQSV